MARAKKIAELRDAKTGRVVMEAMVPRAENDLLSMAMRVLTQQLIARGHGESTGDGFFGGTFGYGVDFSNDVFEMHPDWQGDCTCGATEPLHADNCDVVTKWGAWVSARMNYAAPPKSQDDIEREVADALNRGMPPTMARLGACASEVDIARMMDYENHHPPPRCTCGVSETWTERDEHDPTCRLEQHCFTFKPSGIVVDWYKYIG